MAAQAVDPAQIKLDNNMAAPFFFPITREMRAQAFEDAKGIRLSLSLAQKRKSCPSWSAPAELWWM
jgi:hypothetical protein